jgi:hypothetical protein
MTSALAGAPHDSLGELRFQASRRNRIVGAVLRLQLCSTAVSSDMVAEAPYCHHAGDEGGAVAALSRRQAHGPHPSAVSTVVAIVASSQCRHLGMLQPPPTPPTFGASRLNSAPTGTARDYLAALLGLRILIAAFGGLLPFRTSLWVVQQALVVARIANYDEDCRTAVSLQTLPLHCPWQCQHWVLASARVLPPVPQGGSIVEPVAAEAVRHTALSPRCLALGEFASVAQHVSSLAPLRPCPSCLPAEPELQPLAAAALAPGDGRPHLPLPFPHGPVRPANRARGRPMPFNFEPVEMCALRRRAECGCPLPVACPDPGQEDSAA